MRRSRSLEPSRAAATRVHRSKSQRSRPNCGDSLIELRRALDTLRSEHPHLYDRLIHSKSMQTDALVIKSLSVIYRPRYEIPEIRLWIEDTALQCARNLWDLHYETRVGLDFHAFVRRCSAAVSKNQQRWIYDVKQQIVKAGRYQPFKKFDDRYWRLCDILDCRQLGTLRMNSLHFCDEHHGAALINGLRHECKNCLLFNLIAFKETVSDSSHQQRNVLDLMLPLHDHRGTPYTLQFRRFCTDGFDPTDENWDFLDPSASRAHPLWYRTEDGAQERVPLGSWVWFIDDRRPVVTAWFFVQRQNSQTGEWELLDDWDEVQRELHESKSFFRDSDHGVRYPCPLPKRFRKS